MLPFRPPAATATKALVVTCVAVQVGLAIVSPVRAEAIVQGFGLTPARLTGTLARSGDALPALATLFTSLFLHGGWLHLGLNMVLLVWLGRQVEWVIRAPRLLGLFLASGAAGGLTHVLTGPQSPVPVVGASGSISALFAAYVVLFARNTVAERRIGPVRLPPVVLTMLWYAAAWIVLQLLTGLAFHDPDNGANIAIWAHIGGFLAGLAIAQAWRGRRFSPPA